VLLVLNMPVQHDEFLHDSLSLGNFRRLSQFVNDYSGIKMPDGKQTMLEGRLRRRLRVTGINSLDDYCHFLFEQGGIDQEAIYLIDAITTNKTDFFREPAHFDYLQNVALPRLTAEGVTRLRAWSAACSIGAEPYTMAMTIADYAERRGPLAYFILATDLCTDVLSNAKKGVYPLEMMATVPVSMQRKHVRVARASERAEVRIAPELRSQVGFARLNFMDEVYPVSEKMHVIFCRNVLIYFDRPTQEKVLSRLCDCLMPNGYLFIGHSESITAFNLPVKTVANTIFQKI